MNRLTQELQDSLKAFRDQDDVIRTVLGRARGDHGLTHGPVWATQRFKVLSELYDSETTGKNGKELNQAKKFVGNLIRREILNYVEKNYTLDENGQVAHRSAGPIIQRPANIQQQPRLLGSIPLQMAPMAFPMAPFQISYNIDKIQHIQSQHNVHHHHSSVDEEMKMKIEDLQKDHKNLQKEQRKQGKEIGDLKLSHTDLKTTVHNTIRKKKPLRSNENLLNCTTPVGRGRKLFNGDDDADDNTNSFIEDAFDETGEGNFQAHCDSLDHLVNEAHPSPNFNACNETVAETKEALAPNRDAPTEREQEPPRSPTVPALSFPHLKSETTNSTVGVEKVGEDSVKLSNEAIEQEEPTPATAPAPAPFIPAPWLCDIDWSTTKTIVGKDKNILVDEAGKQEEPTPATATAAPTGWSPDLNSETTNGSDFKKFSNEASKQEKTEIHPGARRSKKKGQPIVPIHKNPNVNSIVLLGESESFTKNLLSKSWDFLHLDSTLEELKTQNPEKDFYLFQGPAFVFDDKANEDGEAGMCPTLGVILVPHGETPPEFVLRYDPEKLIEEVVSFQDFGVEWKTFSSRRYGEKVFALKKRHGKLRVHDLNVTKLWTLQGDALSRKDNGDLALTKAVFKFKKPNGETIHEWYVKDMSTYTDICRMHGMVLKDKDGNPLVGEDEHPLADPELLESLKEEVRKGFKESRIEREEQITMLQALYPSFASHSVIKVFPKDEAVLEFFRKKALSHKELLESSFFAEERKQEIAEEGPFPKLGYINEWYGTAQSIIPDPMKVLDSE